MATRYPIKDTILWPLYHARPSTRNYSKIPLRPLSHAFESYTEDCVARLLFFGDMMSLYGERLPKTTDRVRALFDRADLVVGNCEAPITAEERHSKPITGFRFQMSRTYLREFLAEYAVAPERLHLSLANNHIGDHKAGGLPSTLQHLERLGVRPLGLFTGRPQDTTVEVGEGATVGLVAWTRWMNRRPFAPDERVTEDQDMELVDWSDLKRERGWDLMIGLPHWEYEFHHFPRAATRELAGRLAEDGFDLIVGHHPHVLQPIEWFGETVCHFSLGNFLGIQLSWPTKLTSLLEVHVWRSGGRRGKLAGYVQHPLVMRKIDGENVVATLDEVDDADLAQRCRERLGLLYT